MPASRQKRRCALRGSVAALLAGVVAVSLGAEPLPPTLRGSWRITRVLPTSNTTCWDQKQAEELVGSKLTYAQSAMRWKGGTVPLDEVLTRRVSAQEFLREAGAGQYATDFRELGIRDRAVVEVDLQHEDMDITGATTEVPGDTILITGPNRIVVSACGVFFEATRAGMKQAASR